MWREKKTKANQRTQKPRLDRQQNVDRFGFLCDLLYLRSLNEVFSKTKRTPWNVVESTKSAHVTRLRLRPSSLDSTSGFSVSVSGQDSDVWWWPTFGFSRGFFSWSNITMSCKQDYSDPIMTSMNNIILTRTMNVSDTEWMMVQSNHECRFLASGPVRVLCFHFELG